MRKHSRRYLVFRYQYREMSRPAWAAEYWAPSERWERVVDYLPATILHDPGIIEVHARNAEEAKRIVKRKFENY
jgi:hypothetical protein